MAKFNEYMNETKYVSRWEKFSDFVLGAVAGAVLATAIIFLGLL